MPLPPRLQDPVVAVAAAAVCLAAAALTAAAGAEPGHTGQQGAASARRPAPAPVVRVGITAGGGRVRVQSMPLEEYVARVLAGEGQPRAGDAAQQALAIAIRTFALANQNRHRREGFELCDTTHCQVLGQATAATRRAAEATAGRVLVHENQPAAVFYSAWCGGRSELPSQVWPGAIDYGFEPAQKDDACDGEPQWSSEIDTRDIERALRLAGLRGNRLRNLRVVARSASGRVTRLRAEGFTPNELSGDDFRMAVSRAFGPLRLKSTMFELRRVSNRYSFTGRGFGHGVGMCVLGAGARAARGESADAILRFYYPGLRIQQYTAASTTLTKAAPPRPAPPAPAPARAADVVVESPAGDERERDLVLEAVRRARDEIAAKAGIKAPATIRVNVHPSVERFTRATGQPWWVSGVTDGTAVELQPITVLQQRGQFERAIRHEVTHALLDAALADREMWVREGAAACFANPAAPGELPGRVRCPSDDELLRPVSAGAHRDAHARAEACFRRQLAQGRDWREVR